jgi:hypothetical protein
MLALCSSMLLLLALPPVWSPVGAPPGSSGSDGDFISRGGRSLSGVVQDFKAEFSRCNAGGREPLGIIGCWLIRMRSICAVRSK